VSTSAILENARDLLSARAVGVGAGDGAQELHRLASSGAPEAQIIKDATYRYLAAGITNAVNFYDPTSSSSAGSSPRPGLT
jgi:predicted NBD/HSP70 family sugar kinase